MTDQPHEHVWQDTGFAAVEDCTVCGITRYEIENPKFPAKPYPGHRRPDGNAPTLETS